MEAHKAFILRRQCWRKRSYGTARAARQAGRTIYGRTHIKLYHYFCTGCGDIHLTKQISAKGRLL